LEADSGISAVGGITVYNHEAPAGQGRESKVNPPAALRQAAFRKKKEAPGDASKRRIERERIQHARGLPRVSIVTPHTQV
jgi:hypothetical protein